MREFRAGYLVEFKSKHLEHDWSELAGTYGVLLDSLHAGTKMWRILWRGIVFVCDECDLSVVGSV